MGQIKIVEIVGAVIDGLGMPEIDLPANGWTPRPYQMRAWARFEAGGKRFVLPWHRRAGKDEFALHAAAVSAFERIGNYWHMLPEASQARKAIWDAVNPHTGRRRIDEAFPKELRETTREHEMMIRFKNGSTWQVVGSDNFNSLVGSPPIGVVFSEYALADPAAWAYLRPILAENGGWAMFISTTRGRNHLYALYQLALDEPDEWFGQLLTADDTTVFTPQQLERERRELIKERGPDEGMAYFLQEYYCSWDSALPGAYYGTWMALADKEKRVGLFPYIKGVPVVTGWDLGVGDSTAIWFLQAVPKTNYLRVIDYYEANGMGLDHFVDQLKKRPYAYKEHLVPHDADTRKQAREEVSKTSKQMLEEAGLKNVRTVTRGPVNDGIQAVRRLLPRMQFNTLPIRIGDENEFDARERMSRGIGTLRNYHRLWDDKLKMFKNNPHHDWSSHGADALRTFASGYVQAGTGPFPATAWKMWEAKQTAGGVPEPPECIDVMTSLYIDPDGTAWTWMRWGIFEAGKSLPAAIVLSVKSGTGIKALIDSLKPSVKHRDSFVAWKDKELRTMRHELLRAGIVLKPIETPGIESAIDIAGQALKDGRVWSPAINWAATLRADLDLYPHGGSEAMAFAFAQAMIYILHQGYLDIDDTVPAEPRQSSFYA